MTEDGELLFIEGSVDGTEIVHAYMTEPSEAVWAAGEIHLDITPDGSYIIDEITRHSGHFQPSEEHLELGLEAFRQYGIEFDASQVRWDVR